MSNFEHADLPRSAEPSISDLASQNLLADSMPPFKVAMKSEAPSIVLAGNDSRSGCSTTDVTPPVETPKPVEQPAPAPTSIDFKPQLSQQQQQSMEQNQQQAMQQSQKSIADAQAQAVNRTEVANHGTVNGTVKNDVSNTAGGAVVDNKIGANTSSVANQVDGSSRNANVVNVGGNSYKSFSNARGEALPGTECQSIAVRMDGYFMGTGGAFGISDSDDACLKAKAVKVNCDATETMGRANQVNSAAEQSWLRVANPAQQAEIINHGINNAKHISDNVVKKSAECAQGEQQDAPPPPAPERTTVVNQGNFATKEELQAFEQRQNSKLDAAYKHGMQK